MGLHCSVSPYFSVTLGNDSYSLVDIHTWVNPEAMLDKCLIGILVPEPPVDDDSE